MSEERPGTVVAQPLGWVVALIMLLVVVGLLIANLVISSDAAGMSGVEERLNATVVGMALPGRLDVEGVSIGGDRLQLNSRLEEAVAAEETKRFTVDLNAGSSGRVMVQGLDGFDPTAEVFAPDGELIASNDDAYSGTRDAEMLIPTDVSGTYEIAVTGFGGMSGRFAVVVTST